MIANIRVGQGFDVHAFTDGRSLILGGVKIEYPRGLLGHSDADVLTHALMDALLGAVNAGDIGKLFPDTEARYAGADSIKLLESVSELLRNRGWRLLNADITVIAQKPKIAPHTSAMRERLAAALCSSPEQISVKGTTTEHLGFAGREEGIAASAVVLLVKEG